MHFDWTISFGSIVVAAAVIGAVFRFESTLRALFVEHEILIRDYADRKKLRLNELPTSFKSRQ